MRSHYLCLGAILISVISAATSRGQLVDTLPRITPRPSVASDAPAPLMSLNGIWLFRPEYPFAAADSAADQLSSWSPISVPAEWVMQSYCVKPGTFAAYRRTFEVPPGWAGQRIKLRFDGVHSDCRVWVNGSKVGEHEGGFTVFEFDVTRQLRVGDNSIIVAVKSESVADTLASASQYAAHQLGGITRKVTLFAVPQVHIASLDARTSFDRQFRNATLLLEMDLANESSQSSGTTDLAFELLNPSGVRVPVVPAASTIGPFSPGQSVHRAVSFRVNDVLKWDPEHPNLYDLRIHIRRNGRTRETVTQRIGFRQVAIRGNRVYVNGRPIKLHGVNRHEVHPLLGRSLTPEFWRKDAELFREANVNYIRTSHYPPAEEFLDACDELGIFVECEAALCWVQHGANEAWKEWDYRSDKFLPYLMRANLENVAANRHHPSIIIWSLANESYWSPSFARVLDAVRRADPTRLTSFHDQCWGQYNNGGSKAQIAVYHYPDERSPERCNREARPVLFGEYTHIETYNRQEGVTDPGIRDNWGGPFERMYELVYRNPGCLGGAIWAGINEIFFLPDGGVCGYGPWGIIDGWRRPKPEYWHVKKSYSPVRVIARERLHVGPGRELKVPLENRYDFTNLKDVGILWSIGGEEGKASVNIAPHQHGVLTIHTKHPVMAGEGLNLRFIDPRGFPCEDEDLSVGTAGHATGPSGSGEVTPVLDSTDERYRIRGEGYVCEIDRTTGRVVGADLQGKRVLAGGPELMILPLTGGECKPDYYADVSPLNNTCTSWRQVSISPTILKDGAVRITSEGSYAEAEGSSILTFRGNGDVVVEYSFRLLRDIDPRQWGVVFYAPLDVDSLSWQRNGQWTTYPSDHIGRLSGSAVAHPHSRDLADLSRPPVGDWASDANELGSNDFRSTKSNITGGSLLSRKGYGVSLPSHGTNAVRAFVDGQRIGLLVAAFNTGGAEPFFAPHYAAERRALRKGAIVQDRFTLHFIFK
jgi:beta-galactosidase